MALISDGYSRLFAHNSACRPADQISPSIRLRRCAAAHGGVMATLSWLWGSPRARSHPHAMWKGDQYPTPAIPAFPPRERSPVPFDGVPCHVYVMSVLHRRSRVRGADGAGGGGRCCVETVSWNEASLHRLRRASFRVITGRMVGLT